MLHSVSNFLVYFASDLGEMVLSLHLPLLLELVPHHPNRNGEPKELNHCSVAEFRVEFKHRDDGLTHNAGAHPRALARRVERLVRFQFPKKVIFNFLPPAI